METRVSASTVSAGEADIPPSREDNQPQSKMTWEESFQALIDYHKLNGHVNISAKSNENPGLGKWVAQQRWLNKKGALPQNRKELLDKLGMRWGVDANFDDHFDTLIMFKEQNGHCLVPFHYSNDNRLGRWVSYLRNQYTSGKLPLQRIEQLEEIGFVWMADAYNAEVSPHQRHWDEMFAELKRFQEEHGHTQVRCRKPVQGYHEKLGTWASQQRFLYNSSDKNMPEERKRRLDSIGFWTGRGNVRDPVLEKKWDAYYERLKQFHQKHNHVLLPSASNGISRWLVQQRILNNQNMLPPHRKKKLDELGVVWDDGRTELDKQKWLAMYERLGKFHKQNGHSDVPKRYQDKKLANWVRHQRDRDRELTDDRRQLLDELDFTWSIGRGNYRRDISASAHSAGVRKQPSRKRKADDSQPPRKRTKGPAVGDTVAVYWPEDDLCYRGKITKERDDNHVFIEYEDGDTEWLDLEAMELQALQEEDPLPPSKVSPPLEHVTEGSRVSVWWPAEKSSYYATVEKIDPKNSSSYKLKYDDGQTQWTDLSTFKFQLVDTTENDGSQEFEPVPVEIVS